MKTIVLVGNPNVGKSVVFARLTGIHVHAANYPGTTVEYTSGEMLFRGEQANLIDIPGTYSLEPMNKAESVARDMLGHGDLVINVVDATNLERNLNLTLELIERGVPMVVALNMWDETAHRGISIDVEALEKELGVPVIPTVALTGEGLTKVAQALEGAAPKNPVSGTDSARWHQIGRIVASVQKLKHHHHTIGQRIEDIAVNPWGGLLLAALVMFASFWIIRGIGEGLINYIFDPFFNNAFAPLLMKLSSALTNYPFIHDLIIGKLISGAIDFKQSFGLLTTGVYVEFGAVLPYVISFYLVLGFLEDVGYLPRLAVLMDNLMHKVGLHGYAVIPHMLGLGCNVPAILATRSLESKRSRFIAITLISIGVPCASLQAMVIGIVGERGLIYVAAVYAILFVTWLITGIALNRLVKGFSPDLILDVPPLRLPSGKAFFKKLRMRACEFVAEATPIVLGGVLIVNVLYLFGIFDRIAAFAAPLVERAWGLPREAVAALVIGFLRKDVAIGMFTPLNLTTHQLVIGCAVLAMTFPCIASFAMILRELGIKYLLLSTLIMLIAAIVMGGAANAALGLVM